MSWQVPQLEGALEELERAGALIMVTSRRGVDAELQAPLKIELPSLGTDAAVELLKARAAGSTAITDAQAVELVEVCGCNALYITIIASFFGGVVTPEVSRVCAAVCMPCLIAS
jgi:hypothetical protein